MQTKSSKLSTEAQDSLEQEILRILTLIACGLYRLSRQPRISDPPDLLTGLAKLSHFAYQHGITALQDPSDYYSLCSTPLGNWGLPILPPETDADSVFISYDELSEDCLALARPATEGIPDVEAEMTENIMLDIKEACSQLRNPQVYAHCRRFLIEHPICTQDELEGLTSVLPGNSLPRLLLSAYEDIPNHFVVGRSIAACPHCGWTIRWTIERKPFCVTSLCNSVIQTRPNVRAVITSSLGRLLRLKRGLQMYVGVPGLSELQLTKELAKMKGVETELWPEFDAYDLKITFKGTGEVWAIDVKDYRNPTRLAREVKPFRADPPWDQAFYAFPQHRRSRGYMEAFRNLRPDSTIQVEGIFFRALVRKVRDRAKEVS